MTSVHSRQHRPVVQALLRIVNILSLAIKLERSSVGNMDIGELPPAYLSLDTSSDVPPMYSCTVRLKAHVLLKCECDSPQTPSLNRRWQLVEAEVCGTKLELYTSQTSVGVSLQHADVGVAVDYHRRSFVLRVRAEGRQFLLAASSRAAMLQWIEKLNEAAAISLPLETRKEPAIHLNPPKRPYACCPTLGDELWRYWREKWYPNRLDRQWLQIDDVDDRNETPTPHGQASLDTAYRWARVLQYGAKWRTEWCGPSSNHTEAGDKSDSSSTDVSLLGSACHCQCHMLDARTIQGHFISP